MKKPPKKIIIRSEEEHIECLTLCFMEDGDVLYYPMTEDPEALAENIGRFVTMVYENPVMLRHIANPKLKVEIEYEN